MIFISYVRGNGVTSYGFSVSGGMPLQGMPGVLAGTSALIAGQLRSVYSFLTRGGNSRAVFLHPRQLDDLNNRAAALRIV